MTSRILNQQKEEQAQRNQQDLNNSQVMLHSQRSLSKLHVPKPISVSNSQHASFLKQGADAARAQQQSRNNQYHPVVTSPPAMHYSQNYIDQTLDREGSHFKSQTGQD